MPTPPPQPVSVATWLGLPAGHVASVRFEARRLLVGLAGPGLGPGTLIVQPKGAGRGMHTLAHLTLAYAGQQLPPGFEALLAGLALRLADRAWTDVEALLPGGEPVSEQTLAPQDAESRLVQRLREAIVVDVGARFDPAPLLAEIAALPLAWVDERQRSAMANGWRSLGLRNRGGMSHASIAASDQHAHLPWTWTAEAKACPRILALIETLVDPSLCGDVHAMALGAGGVVEPHSDAPEFEASLNLALSHPPGCEVRLGLEPGGAEGPRTQVVPFAPGVGFLLDVARWHRIDNPTETQRIHLVVRTPWQAGALGRMAAAWEQPT